MHASALTQLPSEQVYQKTQMHQWVRSGTIHILFPIGFSDLPSLGPCQSFQVSNYSFNEWVGCYATWFLITISHSIFKPKGWTSLKRILARLDLRAITPVGQYFLVLPYSYVSSVWSYSTLLTLTDCSGGCSMLFAEPIWISPIDGCRSLKSSEFQHWMGNLVRRGWGLKFHLHRNYMTEKMSLDKSKMWGAGGSYTTKAPLPCPPAPSWHCYRSRKQGTSSKEKSSWFLITALCMASCSLKKYEAFTHFH